MNFKRHYISILQNRLKEPRKFIQVVSGPRQVGKTTLIQQLLDESDIPFHYASADAVDRNDSGWILQQWERCRLSIRTGKASEMILCLDEIQKIHDWSDQVKAEWDRDSRDNLPVKVVLLGSSRVLIMQGLSESLAGRFESLYMTHWTYTEMKEAFGISPEQYAWFGGYPGPCHLIGDEMRWKAYISDSLVETAITRDILYLTRIDKPALLKRMFELGCMYSGQVVSFTKLLGQLQDAGNTTTLAHYLDLTERAGMLGGLQKFSRNRIRQRASSPKFQVMNNGLLSFQMTETFADIHKHPQIWGRVVESAIGSHLMNSATASGMQLLYWREGNLEVDFILRKGDRFVALEVKTGLKNKLSGLSRFNKLYLPYRSLVIGNRGIPWQDFLSMDPVDLLV